jgi:YD repeat-containing protein
MTDYRKLFDLTGKTAVVLGAASGIGKSSAEALASLGARVLCADRTLEGADATAAAIREQGGSATAAGCDAADRRTSRRWQRRRLRNFSASTSRSPRRG